DESPAGPGLVSLIGRPAPKFRNILSCSTYFAMRSRATCTIQTYYRPSAILLDICSGARAETRVSSNSGTHATFTPRFDRPRRNDRRDRALGRYREPNR